jgi:1-acyl-sn-glycerol-3-phosphate acyltransferase
VHDQTGFRYPAQAVVDLLRLTGYAISKSLWFLTYEGLENLPPNDSEPFVLAANHQTYVDPVWVCLPLRRRIRYMAFSTAFGWPLIGRLISYLGAFPVPHDGRGSFTAMKTAIASLREGSVLVVFPEGGRALADGELQEFRAGAFRIAQKAAVPVIPVTISGGNRIWPQKQKYPRLFRRVIITYHPAVRIDETDEDLADKAAAIRKTIKLRLGKA